MKIGWMCDLHLPYHHGAVQYRFFDWAMAQFHRKNADVILFAGDATADGNAESYGYFLEKWQSFSGPTLWIPGNSDLRNQETRSKLHRLASPCRNTIGEWTILAVNDADGLLSPEAQEALAHTDRNTLVFMHHPIASLRGDAREFMLRWRAAHPEVPLFFGHIHRFFSHGYDYSLPAGDPDKNIGDDPAIAFFDTDTDEFYPVRYSCPMPAALPSYLGISCYRPESDLKLAVEWGLKHIELRPGFIRQNPARLTKWIDRWRSSGGQTLSVHLPDVRYEHGVQLPEEYSSVSEAARLLGADRFTQHVPRVPIGVVRQNPEVLHEIADVIGQCFAKMDDRLVIGVENMHMVPGEPPDDSRRFGYCPAECRSFMQALRRTCAQQVGINLDVGHARNNAPFSQTYPIGVWYAELGNDVVGYHIHQVTHQNGIFENHMPITDVRGALISYASFFENWQRGLLHPAPMILEMRPEGAYETSLQAFSREKARL